MSYYFMDSKRLQLFFDTPNVCAAFLSMGILLLLGLFLYSKDQKALCWRICASLAFLGFAILEVMLVMTYSRGGIASVVAGMLFVWFFARKRWIPIFLSLLFFMLLLVSNAPERIKSAGEFSDGSILNRFLIWKGALCMIADNPFSGAGADKIGELYTLWYQPLWLDERYITMVSDPLTIGTAYGLLFLLVYFLIFFMILYFSLQIWKQHKNIFILCASGAVVCYMTASFFTTLYQKWEMIGLLTVLMLYIAGVTIFLLLKRKLELSRRGIFIPFVCSSVFCIGLLISGFLFRREIPYDFTCLNQNEQAAPIWYAVPKSPANAFVIYLYDTDNPEEKKRLRHIIRGLLNSNHTVLATGVDSGFDGLKAACSLLKITGEMNREKLPVFIFGTENGGKHALVAASNHSNSLQLAGVIAVDSPMTWPFDELSPKQHIGKLKVSLCLLGSEDKNDEFSEVKTICADNKIPVFFDAVSFPSEKNELPRCKHTRYRFRTKCDQRFDAGSRQTHACSFFVRCKHRGIYPPPINLKNKELLQHVDSFIQCNLANANWNTKRNHR